MSSTLRAETVTANVLMTTDEEVGASAPLPAGARGTGFATFDITRDSTGKITAATVNFTVGINFPSGVTVTGLHIHSAARGSNGMIWADTGLGGSNSITFSSGQGRIELRAVRVDLVQLQGMLNNPSQHYFNLHTTANGGGAIRGQIVTLSETMGATVALTTAEEVGPSAPLPTNAFGSATATINPFRRPSDGAIIGGAINFVTTLNLPPNSVVTGFHIHEAAAGSNGAIVLDSSLSGSNSVSLPTGQGTLSFPIRLTTPAQIGALQRLMANPANFYFNVHTSANGSGVVRG
ncbi:MAG TPA: CHRD domain-containing protein, partial [Blastocatellia bacterium]|nr:CHRD domain-containing protein [Blastocatellia bacterium]